MATYTRAGSYLVAAELAKDPFGSLCRGVQTAGAAFDRHVLLRTFSDELFQAGMGTKAADVERIIPLLGSSRAFGLGFRYEGGRAPVCACDYVPGRSLSQLIEKAQQEQLPFGVDHALSVIQGVAQAVVQMHAKGVTHGLLSPHSIWVSFEGASQIVDAPYASAMKAFLPKASGMQTWLAPYLQLQGGTPLQQDLFGVGAILYELLTFRQIPVGGDIASAISGATLKAAQEDSPVPAEIKAFLARLLVPGNPFNTVEAFNAELERVLYDGDYSPTTFNMAFFMHTLFRDENEKDTLAIKAEQSENYTAFTAMGEALRSGATRSQHIEGFEEEEAAKGKNRLVLFGAAGAAAIVLIGGGLYMAGKSRSDEAARVQLLEIERMKAELAQQKADLDAQNTANQQKQQQIQQQLQTTTSAQEKAALQQQLEEAQKKQKDLEAKKQKVAAAAQQAEQSQEQIQKKVAKVEPPAPRPQPAAQAPVQAQPTPVAPTPSAAPVQQPAEAPAGTVSDTGASVVSRATPNLPARARNPSSWGPYREVTVKLRVFLDETGRPLKATILQGSPINIGFDDAAMNAAMQSQYAPATRNGQPTRGTVEMTYNFKR